MIEIERKWLLASIPMEAFGFRSFSKMLIIEQIYNPENKFSERVRKITEQGEETFFHCVKTPIDYMQGPNGERYYGLDRINANKEEEREITEEEYLESKAEWKKLGARLVVKERGVWIYEGNVFEVDYFLKPSRIKGLTILEVEIPTPDTYIVHPPANPGVYVREITGASSFSNRNISLRPSKTAQTAIRLLMEGNLK